MIRTFCLVILILVATCCATGQHQGGEFTSKELIREYVLFTELDVIHTKFETIELKKRGRFNYLVSAIGKGIGYVHQPLAIGQFTLHGDTIMFLVKKKFASDSNFNADNLRSTYLIKKVKLDESKDGLLCLIPLEKVIFWKVSHSEYLRDTVSKVAETHFWKEHIFTSNN